MKAMQFEGVGKPLCLVDLPVPEKKEDEYLIRVEACAVCRTDLHIIDGDLKEPKLPLILGHQIVGTTENGVRIGVPWLSGSCHSCEYCKSGKENLCDSAIYTGYQKNGGFAEYCTAKKAYCFPIPKNYTPEKAAPLLCGGLIGYRAYSKIGRAKKIGFYGFGAAAHILIQIAKYEKKEIFAFVSPGDTKAINFAKEQGAIWAGSSEESPPSRLDAAIIFAPVGELVPVALKHVKKGGHVILAGIHMSDIPSFPYSLIWGERVLESVANLTKKDGENFFSLLEKIPIETSTTLYPLEELNRAIEEIRNGQVSGSSVIQP